jgi:hypothetical protein
LVVLFPGAVIARVQQDVGDTYLFLFHSLPRAAISPSD